MLSSRYMIKEDNLSILISGDFNALCSITRGILARIYIDNLPISFVSEQYPCIRVSVEPEVRGVIKRTILSLPIVIREVTRFGKENLLPLEIESEVLNFKAMCEINVAADLILAVLIIANENDSGHSSITDELFSLR